MNKLKSYRVRVGVMLAFLVVVAIGYFTAAGIGNACGIGFDTITLICPLGALLVMISEKTLIPFAVISIIAVLIICAILGRIFCSWICPVPFMSGTAKGKKKPSKRQLKKAEKARLAQEAKLAAAAEGGATNEAVTLDATSACASCKVPCGKSKGMKIDSRHGILAAALLSTAIFGFPVFCLVCPVGLTFATVLLVMRLFVFGATTWTIVVFPLIILVELLLLPKWCKNFCPLGALLSLFSGLNKTFRPTISESKCLKCTEGKACNLCEEACPEGINLHNIAAGETTLNDCTKCRLCADACPSGAITFPLLAKKKPQTEDKVLQGGEEKCPSSHS